MAMTLDGTKGLVLPTWTTAGRPTDPANGQMGYNTSLGHIEWYYSTDSTWYPTYTSLPYIVEYLLVGGGGGGGETIGGGGGGGGVRTGTAVKTFGNTYTVVIGAGGAGGLLLQLSYS